MATVITNLVSAIPYIGNDLVVSTYNLVLPTIGIISPHAIKKKEKEINYPFNLIPYSFLSMLVGFIDGDGYFSILKTKKGFISIKLVISLELKDLITLEYIKSILNFGKIYKYPKHNRCVLVINRTDLQRYLLPLLIYHNIYFLTDNRIEQFNKMMYILKENIKLYNDIPKFIPFFNNIPKNSKEYSYLPFFKNWIIGFTIAEGSFFIKKNKDACFQLHHSKNLMLFTAFNDVFLTNKKIYLEYSKYNKFSLSSKKDIQNVINFFSYSGNHPLTGLKLIQYQNWLMELKKSKQYSNLIIPV